LYVATLCGCNLYLFFSYVFFLLLLISFFYLFLHSFIYIHLISINMASNVFVIILWRNFILFLIHIIQSCQLHKIPTNHKINSPIYNLISSWSNLSKTHKPRSSLLIYSKKPKIYSEMSTHIWPNFIMNMAHSYSTKFKTLWTFSILMLFLKLQLTICKTMILLMKTKIIKNKVAPICKKFKIPKKVKQILNKNNKKQIM